VSAQSVASELFFQLAAPDDCVHLTSTEWELCRRVQVNTKLAGEILDYKSLTLEIQVKSLAGLF
jgi:hypothetical protein